MQVLLDISGNKIVGLSLDEIGLAVWSGEINEFMIGTTIK